MKKLIILTIFSVVLCLINCDDVKVDPEPPMPPPNVTTIAPPTEPPAPTTQPPTTQPPTTKPPAPTTSSTKPPTTKTTTTTTTTTTTVAPTIKPTPQPKPEVHTWFANYTGTNRTCIVLKMILVMDVPYEKMDNTTGNATIFVPTAAVVNSSCQYNSTEQNLTLTWQQTVNISDSVTFTFEKNATSKKFMLKLLVANITPDDVNFPNASNENTIVVNHTHNEFLTPVAMSYRCKQEEIYKMNVSGTNNTGKFIISNLQLQAFRNSTNDGFDSAKDCEAGETPGIVPIAVGCSLAVLIIIVLVAYLVGRRRSQARGYLSMFSEKQREAEYIPMKNMSCFGK